MVKSVYIHIPFCSNICTYCDFAKVFYNEKLVDDYLAALKKEVEINYQGETLNTIYIGGGTPSSLNEKQLKKLFEIVSLFNVAENYEFTFEVNVEDIDDFLLSFLRKKGVNRLSIGVQSFNEKYIDFLGRKHTKEVALKNLKLAKKYFDNISVDLIYAIPNQTLEELEEDLNLFLNLDIPHISCYSLIIEEHTKLFINKTKNIEEDIDYEMYQLIIKKLKDYNHYEISNFAKKDFSSKHNLVYWNNEEYYGFGVGAAFYVDNIRGENTRSFRDYLFGKYRLFEEELDLNKKLQYEFILGFRKLKGINIEEFNEKYQLDLLGLKIIKDLLVQDKLLIEGDYIKINPKYIYVSNEILLNFIEED